MPRRLVKPKTDEATYQAEGSEPIVATPDAEVAPVPKSEGFQFDDANARNTDVPAHLAAIVEKVFLTPAEHEKVYAFIHENLALGEKLANHGYLVRALDLGETVHRMAHRLFVSFKLERLAWERDAAVNAAALRRDATAVLQNEKAKGQRSKAITDADVESTCAYLFPSVWKQQQTDHDRLKLTEDSLANLVEVCASRCRSLQALLAKSR